MKVVHFKASSNSCAPASIWWAKWCPGDLPRIAGRDAELGKVVGWHPEICGERGRAISVVVCRRRRRRQRRPQKWSDRAPERRCNRERSTTGNSILDVHKTTNSGVQLCTSLYFKYVVHLNFLSFLISASHLLNAARTEWGGRTWRTSSSSATAINIGLARSPEVAPVKCLMSG